MNAKQIREITATGITYVDENDEEQFIDFAACYENYVRKCTATEYWERYKKRNNLNDDDYEKYVERQKSWQEVGARQILGMPYDDGPYVEFHTDPPKKIYCDSEDEFHLLTGKIGRFGWMTFDRS